MPSDPGNTLSTATSLTLKATNQAFSDLVSSTDDDYFRFRLDGRSSFNLSLTGLDGNADVQLLDHTGVLVQQSTNTGNLSETINTASLDAGIYYIRVFAGSSSSANYTLSVQTQSTEQTNIVWRNYSSGQNSVWQMNGVLFSTSTQTVVSDTNYKIEGIGDFNGDGQADLVWHNVGTGQSVLWQMNGISLTTTAPLPSMNGATWSIASVNDFNGDGHPDILWRDASGTGRNVLWVMNGVSFSSAVELNAVGGANWKIVGTADFDGDLQTDILWRDYSSGRDVLWVMNGTVQSTYVELPQITDTNWAIAGISDFSGDGQTDILWRNTSNGQNLIWQMNGVSRNAVVNLASLTDTNWRVAGIDDFDGDGQNDILWRNYGNGQNNIWQMNGMSLAAAIAINTVANTDWKIIAPMNEYGTPSVIDNAGNTTATAFGIGTLNGSGSYSGTVGTSDSNDYYRFNLTATTGVRFQLTGLSGDANLQLLDSSGNILQSSSNTGSTAEVVTAHLNAGTYYVRVYANGTGSSTNYGLYTVIDRVAPAINAHLGNDTVLFYNTAPIVGADGITSAVSVVGSVTDVNQISSFRAGFENKSVANYVNVLPQMQAGGSFSLSRSQLDAIYGSSLPEGVHTLTLQAQDEFGNLSAPFALTFTLDTIAPVVPTVSLAASSDSGSSDHDQVTKEKNPTTIQGTAEAGSLVIIYRDQGTDGAGRTAVYANSAGMWQAQYTNLSDGVHTFTVDAGDVAGNLSAFSTPLSVTIDAVAPTVTVSSLSNNATLMNNARLSGSANGTGSAIASVTYYFDTLSAGQSPISVPVQADGSFDAAINFTGISNGAHTLTAKAIDQAGNEFTLPSYSVTVNWDLDASVIIASLVQDTGTSNSDGITSNPTITGTVTDTSQISALRAGFDSTQTASFVNITTQLQADGSFTLNQTQLETIYGGTLPQGAHTLHLQAVDGNGNVSNFSLSFILDSTAPIAPSNVQLTSTSDTGTSSSDGITKIATPTISGQAEAGSIIKLLSNGQVVGQAPAGTDGTWQVTTNALADGFYELTATATDAAGNVSLASTVLEMTIDSAAPELYLDTPTNVVLTQQTHLSGFVDGTGSDITSVQYQFDNLTPVSLTVGDYGDFDQALNYTGVSNGAHTLTVTTTDGAGNVATNQFTVMVNQNITAPALSAALATDTGLDDTDGVTANPTVTGTLTGGSAIAQLWAGFDTVTNAAFTNVTTAINSTGSFTLNQTQLATIYGGTLPQGVHTLHLQARDADGNLLSVSDVALFLDTVNPQLTITSALDTNPLGNGAHITGTVNGTGSDLVALQYQFDNQPAIPLSLGSTGSFDELIDFTGIANGTHTLTILSTDLAGNVTSSQFNVNVQNSGTAQSTSLTLALATDTGTNTTDGITSNPKITGTVTGTQVVQLLVSLDNSSYGFLSDVTSALGTDGSFTLDAAQLADVYGGTLSDGAYTLRLQAVDAQGTVIGVSHVAFTLDSTAPDLNVPGLINGITWMDGQEVLQGTLTDFDPGTTVSYYFDGNSASATTLAFDSSGAFNHSLTLPQEFGTHTLDVVATDQAGNQQDLKYTFLIKQPLKAVDDETLPTTGDNGGGSGGGGNASQWSPSSGGSGNGIWGHSGGHLYGNGPGQGDDPLGSLGDPNALYGDGYGTDVDYTPLPNYMEKLAIILDNAVASIGNTGEDLKRKAVLKHREALLMEIGDMTQQGGFYNRMASAMHGIYDLANNHPIETRAEATAEGGTLATQILADTDAVKVEIYNATLLAAVNSVFVDKYRTAFTSADQAEYRNMVTALMELSRTYAALNPTAPDDKGTSTTPDFLDSLWRAQKVVNNEPLSMADMRMEMQRGVKAIGDLLTGVENPLKAIQFVNNLIQAATNVGALKDDIHDAKFLRELVEFGFEYAKLNPTGTANTGSDAINTFLDKLWRGGDVRQAQEGLSEFFEGFTSETQRIKLLNFEDNLLKANGQLQGAGLQNQKHDVNFIGSLIGLGSAYAALNPQLSGTDAEDSHLFLNTLYESANVSKGVGELVKFLENFTSAEKRLDLLNFEHKLLKAVKLLPYEQLQSLLPNPSSSQLLLDWGAKYIESLDPQNQDLVVNNVGGFFQDVKNGRYDKGFLVASNSNPLEAARDTAKEIAFWLVDPIGQTFAYAYINGLKNATHSPANTSYAFGFIREIVVACLGQGIKNKSAIAFILGIAAHESNFGYNFRTGKEDGMLVERESRAKIEKDYANLNGNKGPKDAWKYRGRGFIQLTGKNLYERYEKMGIPIMTNPDLLATRGDIAAFVLVNNLRSSDLTRNGKIISDFTWNNSYETYAEASLMINDYSALDDPTTLENEDPTPEIVKQCKDYYDLLKNFPFKI